MELEDVNILQRTANATGVLEKWNDVDVSASVFFAVRAAQSFAHALNEHPELFYELPLQDVFEVLSSTTSVVCRQLTRLLREAEDGTIASRMGSELQAILTQLLKAHGAEEEETHHDYQAF